MIQNLIMLLISALILSSCSNKTVTQKRINLSLGSENCTGFADMHTYFFWIKYVEKKGKLKGNFAVGKPTAPLFPEMRKIGVEYWKNLPNKAINYGHPKGEELNRKLAAKALSKIYNVNISPKHILFTVGGKSAIYSILKTITDFIGDKKIITTLPYYMDYAGYACDNFKTNLAYVDLASGNTDTLNASLLRSSLKKINNVGAFLFCDPNNPMGTTLNLKQWQEVGQVLREYPNAPIILDEAYAEMVFDRQHTSLLTACPDLYERLIILRSATKGFSAAGERMALIISPNKNLINAITYRNMSIYIHSPKSLQYIYAKTLSTLHPKQTIRIANFYKTKVIKVYNTLKKLNLLPTVFGDYKPNSSFYTIANLSCFKKQKLHPKAQKILRKKTNTIKTDLDLSYHLLFKYGIALAPLSYFGFCPKRMYMRITCSMTDVELKYLLNVLKKVQ